MLPLGVWLPTLHNESMGGLLLAVDTSGSVGPQELDQIAGEIRSIMEDCRPAFIEVVYCDTSIKHVQRFAPEEPLVLEARGGGGTRFAPVFEYARDMQDPIAAVVYLTDLCGNASECEDPGVPTVWACTCRGNDNMVLPFGRLVSVIV